MNLNWYIASLFVIKPDAKMHSKLLTAVASDSRHTQAAGAAYSEAGCQQAWEDFYLDQFGPIEAAPAFSPINGQQHAPVMRLASGYALNPIFWYEKYDWSLARVKEYASMQGDTLDDVPAHALGFPRVKPWNWIMCAYFNIHALWARWRYTLLNESFTGFIVSYSMLIAFIAGLTAVLVPLINSVYRERDVALPGSPARFSGFGKIVVMTMKAVHRYGWTLIAYSFGMFTVFTTLVISWLMIPGSAIYFYAWPIFICLSIVLCAFTARLLALIMCASLTGKLATAKTVITDAESSIGLMADNMDRGATLPSNTLVSLLLQATSFQSYVWPLMFWSTVYGLLQLEIYPHFVAKIIFLVIAHTYLIVALAAPYSAIFRLTYFAKVGSGVWREL